MKKRVITSILAAGCAIGSMATAAEAQIRFIGDVFYVGYTFCPRGSTPADGRLLSIAENTALFSLLGTNYGGDGRTTFGVPDMRGRAPMHAGTGPGLTPRILGQKLGTSSVTLTAANLPNHSHNVHATQDTATTGDPAGAQIAHGRTTRAYKNNPAATGVMAPGSVGVSGGGQPVDNMQPYLVMRACISTTGLFPSRS